MKNFKVKTLIANTFSKPTAPFREQWVLDFICETLKTLKVPYFIDSSGNIVSGVKSSKELLTGRRNIFVAHTDHPGFHLIKPLGPTTWQAKWLGGCPPKIRGCRVAIYSPQKPGQVCYGKILSPKLDSKKHFKIKLIRKHHLDNYCFGSFDFPPAAFKKSRVYTRAADDLTGVVIILATLARLTPLERKNVVGLFTRAEEVGFIGAVGFLQKYRLGRHCRMISLEASKTLPEAIIGKGPIIRLGDKRTMFDSSVILQLDKVANGLKNFKVQRRVMGGGSCEATAFNLFGIRAAGLSIPLGNYHNEKPNGRPGPEYVDVGDVEGAVKLCVAYQKQFTKNKENPTDILFKAIKKGFKTYKALLDAQIPFKKDIL